MAAPDRTLHAPDELKRRAAERAVGLVEDGMVLGLGTGSTVRFVLEALAQRLEDGRLKDIAGVPTSRATERLARELEIPLTNLESEPRLDLTQDGADEIAPHLDLIKGLGGALLWEKIVAAASETLVIVADASKLVDRLGTKAPVPVEVVPFGWPTHLPFLDLLGIEPQLRTGAEGRPFVTDSGHYILDCRFRDGITDAERIERELRQGAGIVETGLFVEMADAAVVAGSEGVQILRAEDGE
jgi:ribose 5-phosphate isomerase A